MSAIHLGMLRDPVGAMSSPSPSSSPSPPLLLLLLLLLALNASTATAEGVRAAVSIQVPPGALHAALASAEQWRRASPSRDIELVLQPGLHILQKPLEVGFNALGSGQLTIRGAAQGGQANISAGVQLNPSRFVALGGNIYRYDLAAEGLRDYGTFLTGSLKDCQHNRTELFIDGQRLWLARWPNLAPNGTWLWSHVVNASNSTGFVAGSDAPLAALAADRDPWLHGYWTFDWSDEYVQVTGINPQTRFVSMGQGALQATAGGRWLAINARSQLDADGEYYIDSLTGYLDVYLASPLSAGSQVFLSNLSHVVEATSGPAANLNLADVALLYARGTAVWLPEAQNVLLDNVTIANHGGNGTVLSGYNLVVQNSEAYNLGCMGISVYGGNRTDLTPGSNRVDRNYIHDYALWKRTYQGGIFWAGVGNNYTNNYIRHGPHNGILGGGNEEDQRGGNNCLFYNNTLENLAFETSDTGAFCMGMACFLCAPPLLLTLALLAWCYSAIACPHARPAP
jgi:hypothetical protein